MLAHEQDYTSLVTGVICVTLFLLMLLGLFMWVQRRKHIEGMIQTHQLKTVNVKNLCERYMKSIKSIYPIV